MPIKTDAEIEMNFRPFGIQLTESDMEAVRLIRDCQTNHPGSDVMVEVTPCNAMHSNKTGDTKRVFIKRD